MATGSPTMRSVDTPNSQPSPSGPRDNEPTSYTERRGQALLRRYASRQARTGEATGERLYAASQAQLVFRRFRRHRLAMVSLVLLALVYLVALFAEFVAPYGKLQAFDNQIYASPTRIHIIDNSGHLHTPFVYASTSKISLDTFQYRSVEDKSVRYPVRFLVRTRPYKLAGFIPMDRKLFGVDGPQPLFLFGADHLGRDSFSRAIYGSRISLLVGFGGVFISFILGLVIGGLSGYLSGVVDLLSQRLIELIISIPLIPLWMALSAAVPQTWTGIQTYFAITIILSLVGWTGLARVVRGKIISLREEDYVVAAKVSAAGSPAIIRRHLIPALTSYLIVNITVAIPAMILGETTLSFLGLGISAPNVSWGSLLQEAQSVTVVTNYPWLLMPALLLVITVVLFNFVGDGLRDAADPYSQTS